MGIRMKIYDRWRTKWGEARNSFNADRCTARVLSGAHRFQYWIIVSFNARFATRMSSSHVYAVNDLTYQPLKPSFHPHLLITYNSTSPFPDLNCEIHLSLALPDALFLDPSTISDHFASQPIQDWSLSPQVIDIERAVLIHPSESSLLGLKLVEGNGPVHLSIPLHARYLAPNDVGSEVVSIEQPISAGWVCPPSGMSRVYTA